MNHPGKIRSLAATARLANVPSVVSNVWLGVLLAMRPQDEDWALRSGAVTLSAICLYLCGGFLNDWADRKWDAAHRPERALPRGLFAPSFYLTCGSALAVIGLTVAAFVGMPALANAAAIVLCVVVYTWLHKKAAWSIVPMGLCRAFLPLLGWSVFASQMALPAVIAGGAALWFYVAGISFLARGESRLQTYASTLSLHHAFFAIPMLAAFVESKNGNGLPLIVCLIGLLPYGLWTTFCLFSRLTISARVSGLLAGISWVDGMFLFPLYMAAGGNQSGFVDACAWLPPLAFVCGKALQRLAPAT